MNSQLDNKFIYIKSEIERITQVHLDHIGLSYQQMQADIGQYHIRIIFDYSDAPAEQCINSIIGMIKEEFMKIAFYRQ